MKTLLRMLCCLLIAVLLMGCGTEKTKAEPEVEVEMEAEPIQEEQVETPVGIWRCGEKEALCVCFFEDGTAYRYGGEIIGIGTWEQKEDGLVEAKYTYSYQRDGENAWVQKRDLHVDPRGGTFDGIIQFSVKDRVLTVEECQHPGEYAKAKTYLLAEGLADFYYCAAQIEAFYGDGNGDWLVRNGEYIGVRKTNELYRGLEQTIVYWMCENLTAEDVTRLEYWETNWQKKNYDIIDGTSGSSKARSCLRERIALLLGWMEEGVPAIPLPEEFNWV